jgi:hypothetical protein
MKTPVLDEKEAELLGSHREPLIYHNGAQRRSKGIYFVRLSRLCGELISVVPVKLRREYAAKGELT